MESMDFSRGDPVVHGFSMPASAWTPGGRLFFAAKPLIDDDNTDANAVIQGNWGDEVVTDIDKVIGGVTVPYKRYSCPFVASDTNTIVSNGAASAGYLGEFQWVSASGVPTTIPATGDKIPVTVWFDVKRKTTT